MKKHILVVGGAGYIGSHMTQLLLDTGYDVTVLDDLSSGHEWAVPSEAKLISRNIAETDFLVKALTDMKVDAVMHFASFIQVCESVKDPAKYYYNNVTNTLKLLNAMIGVNVNKFIFSSTAATFGNPQYVPIDEKHEQIPINPYGRSKLMIEQILKDYDLAYGVKSVVLRYFNAAGAHPAGNIGEAHDPETHLIPLVLRAAEGKGAIKVFGDDYETSDGTCIRDYIHVCDLCEAHLLALQHLLNGGSSDSFNLGTKTGISVMEVIKAVERVTGKTVPFEVVGRRDGDPAILVADSTKAQRVLGWEPQYRSIDVIVQHAWKWEKTRRTQHALDR